MPASSDNSSTGATAPTPPHAGATSSGIIGGYSGKQTGELPSQSLQDLQLHSQQTLAPGSPRQQTEPIDPVSLYSVLGGAAVILMLSLLLMRKARQLMEKRTALPYPHVFFSVFSLYAIASGVLTLTVMDTTEGYWIFRFFFWALLATVWGKLFAIELDELRPRGKQKRDLHYQRHTESLRFEPYQAAWILGGIGFSMVGFGWLIGELQPVAWSVYLGGPIAALGAVFLFLKLWQLVRGDWQSFAFIAGWLFLGLLSLAMLLFPSVYLGTAVIAGEILVLALCFIPPHSNFSGVLEEVRQTVAEGGEWEGGAVPKLYKVEKQNQLLDDPNFESGDFEITDKSSLRTEPGRKKKEKIDPWTGLEVQEGEEDSSEERRSLTEQEEYTEEEFFIPNSEDEETDPSDEEEMFDELDDYTPDVDALEEEDEDKNTPKRP